MIGTEILELCAVLEHVVDRREERGSDGADCLFWSTSAGETVVLSVEVATFLALGGPSTLDQQGLEPPVAFSQPGGSALAGTLVVARAQPGPRQEVSRGRKRAPWKGAITQWETDPPGNFRSSR
jgi:hypothetical protein